VSSLLVFLPGASSQQASAVAAPANGKQTATPPSTGSVLPLAMPDWSGRDDLILKHLNAVLTWFHNTGNEAPSVTVPTDAIYLDNARSLSQEAVQAAFQSAGADALLISRANASGGAVPEAGTDVSKLVPQLESQITQAKSQIESLNSQISLAGGRKAQALIEERVRLQGQLELLTAEDTAVQQLAKYTTNNGSNSGTSLQRSIAQLQRNVPEAAVNTGAKKPTPAATTVTPIAESAGLIGEAEQLLSQAGNLHRIDVLAGQAATAEDLAKQLRAPLITQIHKTLALAAQWSSTQQGTATSGAGTNVAGATTPGPTTPGPTKQQFDALTAEFKQLSAPALPLSQEIIALDQSRTNLQEWRQSLSQEYKTLWHKVLTRVGAIVLALGFIALLSVLSNRLIFRYVSDIRRRRQILIIRRFVVGFLMSLVVVLGFVSEFSSLATFAGFITAGIAVGLQTILLSVAAYFFIVGRYGIRVGDRISIAGTTGDVIDVGLIRLYLMELAGTGNDLFPTGRIVVFPNSVLFQATVPLYKQIPGTEYAWHEVAATLTPGANAQMVQEKMLEAVNSVHQNYRATFERQHAASSRVLDIHLEVPSPSAHLQFATAGLELVVRYPVALGDVAKADEEVTQKLLAALEGSADLKSAVTGMPLIRVAVKG